MKRREVTQFDLDKLLLRKIEKIKKEFSNFVSLDDLKRKLDNIESISDDIKSQLDIIFPNFANFKLLLTNYESIIVWDKKGKQSYEDVYQIIIKSILDQKKKEVLHLEKKLDVCEESLDLYNKEIIILHTLEEYDNLKEDNKKIEKNVKTIKYEVDSINLETEELREERKPLLRKQYIYNKVNKIFKFFLKKKINQNNDLVLNLSNRIDENESEAKLINDVIYELEIKQEINRDKFIQRIKIGISYKEYKELLQFMKNNHITDVTLYEDNERVREEKEAIVQELIEKTREFRKIILDNQIEEIEFFEYIYGNFVTKQNLR
ncbi:MAG: hypothetical protein R3Y13_02165 [bacterium]